MCETLCLTQNHTSGGGTVAFRANEKLCEGRVRAVGGRGRSLHERDNATLICLPVLSLVAGGGRGRRRGATCLFIGQKGAIAHPTAPGGAPWVEHRGWSGMGGAPWVERHGWSGMGGAAWVEQHGGSSVGRAAWREQRLGSPRSSHLAREQRI